MDLSNPLATVTGALDASVLQVLAATTSFCTAAEVHRRSSRGSDQGVRKVLDRLVEQGIVAADTSSRNVLYRLNRDHLAAKHIIALSWLRMEVVDSIKAEISLWTVAPIHSSLFGSFARGSADESSDIDVLVVRPSALQDAAEETWLGQVGRLVERITIWTGNAGHVLDVTPDTLGRMARENDPLVQSWRAEQVPLFGAPLLELLRKLR